MNKLKEKGNGCGYRKYLSKEYDKEFTIICGKYMSMVENHTSGYLYNEPLSEGNKEKHMTFQTMAWSLFIKNSIKNCSTAPSSDLSLCIFYFLFYKGKYNSVVPPPSVQHLVYIFINALITST